MLFDFAKFGLTSFTSGYIVRDVTYRFIFYTVLAIFSY